MFPPLQVLRLLPLLPPGCRSGRCPVWWRSSAATGSCSSLSRPHAVLVVLALQLLAEVVVLDGVGDPSEVLDTVCGGSEEHDIVSIL